jgi:predicted RNA-binding Zn-ribbon protein involved in translation (DUF1610 family)
MTRQELAKRQRAFDRDRMRRLSPRLMAVMLVLVFTPLVLAIFLKEFGAPKWATNSLAVSGVIGCPLSAWCADIMLVRLKKAHQVGCPQCGKALIGLVGQQALTTGRCTDCGKILFPDPGTLMSIDPGAQIARHKRLRRLTVVGCSIGLVAAWGTLIPLKSSGPMPPHMTWPAVVFYPLTMFGWVAAIVVLPTLYPRRALAWMLAATVVAVLVALVLSGLFSPGGEYAKRAQ